MRSMRCSVFFGVRLRLLGINISSSSPAINTAAYYQRSVITCETVAVVHRRPRFQHLAYCSVNTGSQARYRLRVTISAYPTRIRRPVEGSPSEYFHPVWCGKTRTVGLPDGEKSLTIRLLVSTQLTNVTHTDRQTDTQTDTAWRHRPRLCIASRGKNWTLFIWA